jgi:hypothetical protein
LAQHALSEVANCIDFAQKSFNSAKGMTQAQEQEIAQKVKHLESFVKQNSERLLIKAFSKSLQLDA